MPRVTDEHRAERREQILEAARRCFSRDGFHQTSMIDIFDEAGLSSGAVYGYFKSKDELIVAIAELVIGQLSDIIAPLAAQDPPPSAEEFVHQVLTRVDDMAFGPAGYGRLAPQVWSEALRNPKLAEVLAGQYREIAATVAELVERQQKYGLVPGDAVPREVVPVLMGGSIGYIVQRLLFGSLSPQSYAAGVAAIAGRPRP
ncbi:MAG TPA: TetR/AcrR family transcriptional regulator [Jiangellaceae bacterium]